MYILSAICSDYALASVLGIIKRIITILQIVVPIFLIIGGSITFSKALINPDDGPKAKKNFLNAIASAVIVFLMPFLINSIMAIISAYGDVGITDSNGNNTAFNISSCWNNANVADISSSSISNYNENTSISDEANGNTRTNLILIQTIATTIIQVIILIVKIIIEIIQITVTKTTIVIIQTAATKIIRIITLTLIVITKITILKLIHQLTIIVVLFSR